MIATSAVRVLPAAPYQQQQITDLFRSVIDATPEAIPPVANGRVPVEEWADSTKLGWIRVACLHGHLVGHIAARNTCIPRADAEPPGVYGWEMCRLVVSPQHRYSTIANTLVAAAETVFGGGMWTTVLAASPAHGLLLARGWRPVMLSTPQPEADPVAMLTFQRRR